jgi:hypothetical protein
VLSALAGQRKRAPVELICIDRFPAIARFVGLGQLTPEALRLLWERRTPVSSEQSRLGVAVWEALREPSPSALHAIAAGRTPELPVMAPALRRHLQELPWTRDGLSLTQHLALEGLKRGPQRGSELFRAMSLELEPLPFLGDSDQRSSQAARHAARIWSSSFMWRPPEVVGSVPRKVATERSKKSHTSLSPSGTEMHSVSSVADKDRRVRLFHHPRPPLSVALDFQRMARTRFPSPATLRRALRRNGGNLTTTAGELGLDYSPRLAIALRDCSNWRRNDSTRLSDSSSGLAISICSSVSARGHGRIRTSRTCQNR